MRTLFRALSIFLAFIYFVTGEILAAGRCTSAVVKNRAENSPSNRTPAVSSISPSTIPNPRSLQSNSYTLNKSGHRTGSAESGGRTITHTYDALYHLTSESRSVGVSPMSSPTSGTLSYSYDPVGNRISRTTTVQSYEYDQENRLVRLVDSPKGTFFYAYDHRSRRVLRDESAAAGAQAYVSFAAGLSAFESTTFLLDITHPNADADFDGWVNILEFAFNSDPLRSSFSATFDAPGIFGYDSWAQLAITDRLTPADISSYRNSQKVNITVEYIRGSDYGGGIGGVLYTIRGGNTRSYNAYNSRGDVVSKTDAGGAITWQAAYEAFGTRTTEQGVTADRQKANTKEEDPTGLLNEGFRYRDLESGTFITRDPLGFEDGPNMYSYVTQNPWTYFDPLGLYSGGGTPGSGAKKRREAREQKSEAEKFDPNAKLYRVEGDPETGNVTKLEPITAREIKKRNAIIWVNGINNPPKPAAQLRLFRTGESEFYMLHNPSNGSVSDLGECSVQKLGFQTQVASSTQNLLKNFDLKTANITAHSQGTMILNKALVGLKNEGIDMTGMNLNYHGSAANVFSSLRLVNKI